MSYVLATVISYLLFNVAIWLSLGMGGLIALGAANIFGAVATAISYSAQVRTQGLRPNWFVAVLGSFGILGIVVGLRGSHGHLPVSLSIEAVYNGFACLSWPMFVVLNQVWPNAFQERPNRFDLACHLLMVTMVVIRFTTYESYAFQITGVVWIMLAICGYMLFNISIKLAKGHRMTNITMNIGGGILLVLCGSLVRDGLVFSWNLMLVYGSLLGGLAIFGIVKGLGESYNHFGRLGKASLVAPLVYDGILVASPAIMPISGEYPSNWTFGVAISMLAITIIRYRHHAK